ncbi:phage head-tail connector protein [Sutcliffiella halmapala]
MDELVVEELILNVQDILGADVEERQIRPYVKRAINFVKNYCRLSEIPVDLYETIEDIAIFKYRSQGIENIKAEGKGSLSESYMESLPNDIINQLSGRRQVRVI